jgi:LmbE family N-acetylglucosaminyl deacetylase
MREWGLVPDHELERMVIVSPHLDDAVLGCGRLLARHPGATVVTLYAGRPDDYPTPMTRWDTLAGFVPGDEVLEARRDEDTKALAEVGASPRWLDFVEHQYLERPDWVGPDATNATLERELRALEPTAVLLPMGLANPDHVATHDAGMLVRERFGDPSWFCYEDAGYKHIPGLLAWRVAKLFRAGIWPTPALPSIDPQDTRKRAAIAHYTSQLLALEADWQIGNKLEAPEQVWRLGDPPQGWELLIEDVSDR